MNYLLLIYIPIIASIAWSFVRVYNNKSAKEAALVGIIGFVVVFNGILRHFVLMGYDTPNALTFAQQLASSLIIPCSYMYFARQVGRPLINGTSTLLLSLMAFLVFPNIVVYYDSTQMVRDVGFMSFLIVGKEVNVYTIADFVIVIQSAIAIIRVLPLYKKIKMYGLSLSDDVKRFIAWWCIATIFIVFASYNSDRGEYDATIDVVCKIGFMLIATRAFYKIGKGFDLRPLFDKQPVEFDEIVSQSREMAARLSAIIAKGGILSGGYTADDAISELGTNRTYFYKMVKVEFGCTFSELLNRERVKSVKEMLSETDYSLNVIADKCGFSNASYMIKIFKHIEGVTPKEWRDNKIVN